MKTWGPTQNIPSYPIGISLSFSLRPDGMKSSRISHYVKGELTYQSEDTLDIRRYLVVKDGSTPVNYGA